ncbi:MAG: PorV/PorQ family protein [candidate division Zixibacteria bacterium]|nr:PorV/PorQ family protein [candidate division Zixibacteria bacterium]
MKNKIVVLTIVLLAVSLSSVYAGNTRRIGTAGAQELLIPYGSRGTAMGGAILADVSGVEAMYWNPAGLASLEGTEAMFTHLPYIADIDMNFVGIATYIDGFGSLGLGAKVVSIGEIEETTEDYPDGTGRVFEPSLTVINVSYARILTANVSFGFSGMFINEDIFEAKATGFAFDVGFIYDPRWRGVKVGLAIKNYGPEMTFSGRGFERELLNRQASPNGAPFDLPSSINMGMMYDFVDNGPHVATIAGNFRSNNYQEDMWQGGMEYVYNELYSLRAGYNFSNQDDYIYGLSLGAGLVYELGSTKLAFEYSWTETEVFDDNQYFTVRVNF